MNKFMSISNLEPKAMPAGGPILPTDDTWDPQVELNKWLDGLPEGVEVEGIDCQYGGHTLAGYIKAFMKKPVIIKGELNHYEFGYFLKKWDDNGNLIKEIKNYEWEISNVIPLK